MDHTLTRLEDELAEDAAGLALRARTRELEAWAAELGGELRRPQTAERYASLERQRRACLAALRVLDAVWRRGHWDGGQLRSRPDWAVRQSGA
ncbi:EscE/YscE/SsaE family type III secretion system needle protein co-chaperone [Chromobacterium phragmitis]|uniref:EscE/YscE/SsaE family type III secretion system needle protein co-chaperone n=1 Tax=Chromobacterium phragmitis TaxID=2202141 RepID=UPI000DECED88|nr:EscE/YscE/SsaE family type III secretion system needle protein co-chaperone [Chromobacterium phragmitis]AXE30566.1 EscE/YscE/SsaE family type III secretion system needle protein co-chaperone [Chromobacterium phragmitis]